MLLEKTDRVKAERALDIVYQRLAGSCETLSPKLSFFQYLWSCLNRMVNGAASKQRALLKMLAGENLQAEVKFLCDQGEPLAVQLGHEMAEINSRFAASKAWRELQPFWQALKPETVACDLAHKLYVFKGVC